MALIKCPECGGEVSSNTDTCVHCGCRFSYCPECGTVHLGKVQKCPACGYRIDAPVRAASGGKTSDEFLAACKRRTPIDGKINLALKIAPAACVLISIFFIIITFVPLIKWSEKNSLDELLRAKDLMEKSHNLVIASLTFLMLGIASINARELYFQILYAKWISKFNVDILKYLNKSELKINASFQENSGVYGDMGAVAYITVVPHGANIKYVKQVGLLLVALGVSIALGNFAYQMIDGVITSKLYDKPIEFSYVPAIIAFVIIFVRYIFTFICDRIFNNRKNEWLKSVNLL